MNKIAAILTGHRFMRRLQAAYRRKHGKEPTILPGESPDIFNGVPTMGSMMKNWQTTILGLLAGVTGTSLNGWTKPDGSINWLSIALGLLISLLGAVAKQHNVTGGTVAQTKVAAASTGESPAGLPGPVAVTPSVKLIE